MHDINAALTDVLQRLVHIEGKIDRLREEKQGQSAGYGGHPDQAFGPSTYAQHGDDLVLLNIFEAIGVDRPAYLDIGAHHPLNISNTALLYQRGCRGVNVEANPNLIGAFHAQRPEDLNLNCGVNDVSGKMTFYMIDKWSGRNSFDRQAVERFVEENPNFSITERISIPVVTVDELIAKHCQGRFPDLLSIDVEGLEGRILRSISYEKWAPKVICAETCRGGDEVDGQDLDQFLSQAGYFCMLKNRGNSFFVRTEYRQKISGKVDRP
jgi:FkbM family methyltransferase